MTAKRQRRLVIGVNGDILDVVGVRLFSEPDVRQWQKKISEAQDNLGGFNSGIGVFGSPGVALASAAAIGIVEAAISNAKAKNGLRLLQEAAEMLPSIRAGGETVKIADIDGLAEPNPALWSSEAPGLVKTYLDDLGIWARAKAEGNMSKDQRKAGFFEEDGVLRRIVLDSEFIAVTSTSGEVSLRWSAVATYSFTG